MDGPRMRLVLENGVELEGRGFGADRAVAGEVVFNSGMTGYVEALTDPSYRGQILLLTYPLVGNYGVPAPRPEGSLRAPYESDRIQVQGLIVQQYVDQYSHHRATRSLGEWLASAGVPAITGIDTRVVTQTLRSSGTMRGWIVPAEGDIDKAKAESIDLRQVARIMGPDKPILHEAGPMRILLVDMGVKDSLVRLLLERGISVLRVPAHGRLSEWAAGVDGIILGSGPGDPQDYAAACAEVRTLLGSYKQPIFGVCLGHQILALAAGGTTYKLPYGHRGLNQPVQDLLTRRHYLTSQNHGYAVAVDSLPGDWEPWFINLHDGTNEGIRSRWQPFFSVQFHPEASPGPRDAEWLVDDFVRLCGALRRPRNTTNRNRQRQHVEVERFE